MRHPSLRKKAEDKEGTHAVSRDTSNALAALRRSPVSPGPHLSSHVNRRRKHLLRVHVCGFVKLTSVLREKDEK